MRPQVRVTLIYLVFGLLWILLSDQLLFHRLPSPEAITRAQTYKGFIYVAVTAVLLYFLVRGQIHRMERAEREKREIFASTMRAVFHILNNFLNSMVYFREAAEDSGGIEPQVLDEYDAVIRETAERIRALAKIEQVDSASIESHVVHPEREPDRTGTPQG